jgi:aminoglycoside 2'-N-acetyltransferase I
MAVITRFTTADASSEDLRQIRRIFFTAFDDSFTEHDWGHVLGGWHIVVVDGGEIVSHAAVVERVLEVGNRPFRTGYVEGVATHPRRQREGLGTQVMGEVSLRTLDGIAGAVPPTFDTARNSFAQRTRTTASW